MSGDVEARKLGEKLLLDVEVKGLSEILSSLRTLSSEHEDSGTTTTKTPFSIPELDALVAGSSPTILELVSPAPTHHPSGAGKTSLLYLVIALAILPPTFNSIHDLNGHDAAIILFDPLHHFSVPRLASVILNLLTNKLSTPISTLDPIIKANLLHLTEHSLSHLHIFHPSSWSSLLATLTSLPTYLFDSPSKKSTHRRIHSLILEDTDAFTPSLRSSDLPSNANANAKHTSNPLTPHSRDLTTALLKLRTVLSCHIILSSPSLLPSGLRPALPVSWPGGVGVTRLGVRRVDVVRFAPEMGVEQARVEGAQRWDVVKRGRFEVWRVGGGGQGEGEGVGFVFRVGLRGVDVERGGVRS